jgi:hypothetical protein
MNLFNEMVFEEAEALADDLRGIGATAVDTPALAVAIRERRLNRESGHFAAQCFQNGNVGAVWVPSPWEDFWRTQDSEPGTP